MDWWVKRGLFPTFGSAENAENPPGRKRRRSGRGVLWVIAAMLAISGLLRLGSDAGSAIASSFPTTAEALPGTPAEACGPSDDIAEVLALLRDREAAVAAREMTLADRMQALRVAEVQIAENMTALKAAEASLEATMALAASASEDDLTRLTSVYENMKPKEATPLFSAMDPQFAAGFLGRMRPDAAAAILAGLDPETAYAISVLLAGRNALAPTN